MKVCVSIFASILFVLALMCPFAACAEPTTTLSGGTTTTLKTTEQGDTTTEPYTTATSEVKKLKTFMTLTFENQTVTVTVLDEHDQPVRLAPIAIAVDGDLNSAQTNNSGVATLKVSGEPGEIRSSMESFKGAVLSYEGCSASVVLKTTTTATSSTTEVTTTTTKTTVRNNQNSVIMTTTDPANGDVTVVVTGTTIPAAEEEENDQTTIPRGLAIGLMAVGGVLLVAAILLVIFFLVRKPRDPEEKINEDVEPEDEYADLSSDEPLPETDDDAVSGEDTAPDGDKPVYTEVTPHVPGAVKVRVKVKESPTALHTEPKKDDGKQVSLEDLFRNKNK